MNTTKFDVKNLRMLWEEGLKPDELSVSGSNLKPVTIFIDKLLDALEAQDARIKALEDGWIIEALVHVPYELSYSIGTFRKMDEAKEACARHAKQEKEPAPIWSEEAADENSPGENYTTEPSGYNSFFFTLKWDRTF